jgi:hypothetical protein
MQYNLLKEHLEKISLELNHSINLLLKEKQKSGTMVLKYLEDLEHILDIGKNILNIAKQKEINQ